MVACLAIGFVLGLRAVYNRERVIQSSNWDVIIDRLKQGWEEGLHVEALAYYSEWIMVMYGEGRIDNDEEDEDEDEEMNNTTSLD